MLSIFDGSDMFDPCLFDNDTKLKLKDGRKKFLEQTFSFQGVASERHVDFTTKLLNNKTNF